ncbi:MAG: hypothetical protein ACYCOO_07655 [Chitinophagaceae bacterium]
MKKLMIASFLLLGIAFNGFAQHHPPKVIALVNQASWCPVCQANGPRFKKDILPMVMKNGNVQMVMNNLTNEETKGFSLGMLKKAGIAKFAENNTETGMIYLLDAKTKRLISTISLAKSDQEIKEAFQTAISKG